MNLKNAVAINSDKSFSLYSRLLHQTNFPARVGSNLVNDLKLIMCSRINSMIFTVPLRCPSHYRCDTNGVP